MRQRLDPSSKTESVTILRLLNSIIGKIWFKGEVGGAKRRLPSVLYVRTRQRPENPDFLTGGVRTLYQAASPHLGRLFWSRFATF